MNRAQDSSPQRIAARRIETWVAGLSGLSLQERRPRVVSLSDSAREFRLGGRDQPAFVKPEDSQAGRVFLCKPCPDHCWLAAVLWRARRRARLLGLGVILKVFLSQHHPLKINSQLGFLSVIPRQRPNPSFPPERWEAGRAEL